MQKTDKDLARKCLEKESIDEKLIVTAGESGSLLEREAFLSAKKGFSVPLGITDDDHQIVVRDFSSIPHVLIGGSTGTGKSSFIRTMLAVLFLHHSPSEVKAIIYDSKCSGCYILVESCDARKTETVGHVWLQRYEKI